MSVEIERVVSHYVYTFGEADGPFKCEHAECSHDCWSIYTTEPQDDPRQLLRTGGAALCDEHAPANLLASLSMNSIAKACG